MSIYYLENETIKVEIHSLGAELKSVFHKKIQKEILYSGKETYWNRSAPVLFPIVGRLKNESYIFENKNYSLSQHGFARNLNFDCIEQENNSITFSLKANEITLQDYPFDFELHIKYYLDENQVQTTYKVFNYDSEEMFFSIGAHPGFVCPLFENESFEDYYLEFEKEESFERHLLNLEKGIFNGETEQIPNQNKQINLDYAFFEKDAIVFEHLNSKNIILKSKKSSYSLEFSFQDFPFFGIWTKPEAKFICLEPWCGLADSENSAGDLKRKKGINLLKPNDFFERSFSFKIQY
ncbi:MAG: aldose 1-epimerase family protein [Flavobacteriia bacterium]|jgi:galactose mutarotase-like enzyme